MVIQISLGTFVMLLSTLVAGLAYVLLEWLLTARNRWLLRPPHALKIMLLLVGSVFWILAIVTVSIWLWAAAYYALGLFTTVEAAVYFSIVAFTTLGFGDVLLSQDWRLLSGMEAINGLVMFGLLTAMLVEVLRRIRSIQIGGGPWSS